MHIASYYKTTEHGNIICLLCPHQCNIKPGKTGVCRVRSNKEGSLISDVYGKVSALNMDPIEKKPLYHFYPGSNILSLGTVGCNLKCIFCQNYEISQECDPGNPFLKRYEIEEIISAGLSYRENSALAYTYNEPTVWYEYMFDIAGLAKKHGLKNVMVTNGYINELPLKELLKFIDAFSVDLKAFTNEFYRKFTTAELEPVKQSLKQIYKSGRHLEITNLVIPGLNDDPVQFDHMVKWISTELSPKVVLHISRYHPAYKLNIPFTPYQILEDLYHIANRYLDFVYLGNVMSKHGNNTICPDCNTILIKRDGYVTQIMNLDDKGKCIKCSYHLLSYLIDNPEI